MNRDLPKKSKRWFGRGEFARGARMGLAALSCMATVFALSCEDTTLWIGSTDAGGQPPPQPPIAPPPPPAAGAASAAGSTATPAGDAGAIASGGAGTSPSKRPTTVIPVADDDAGTIGTDAGPLGKPATHVPPPILRPTDLPVARTPCPAFNGDGMYRFGDPAGRNLSVEMFVSPRAIKQKTAPSGALILYWHAIGDGSDEVMRGFGKAAIDQVVADGGVVASFVAKLCVECGLARDVSWYEVDDEVADHVVACALQEARIDSRRIHAIGFSAGALHSLHLALARSNYIASVVSYSGGMGATTQVADVTNKVPALLSYGTDGRDAIFIDFGDLSLAWYDVMNRQGYYNMLCAHELNHDIPTDLVPHVLQFFDDHPYRVSPEPYLQAIPASFPSYCSNTPRTP